MKDFSQAEMANGLLSEFARVFNNYEGTMIVQTAIGVLELMKIQLVLQHMQKQNEDK